MQKQMEAEDLADLRNGFLQGLAKLKYDEEDKC